MRFNIRIKWKHPVNASDQLEVLKFCRAKGHGVDTMLGLWVIYAIEPKEPTP